MGEAPDPTRPPHRRDATRTQRAFSRPATQLGLVRVGSTRGAERVIDIWRALIDPDKRARESMDRRRSPAGAYVSPAPVMKPHTADTIAIAARWIQALMSTKLQSCTLSERCIINKPLIIEKACRPVSLSESTLSICLHFSSRASAELPTS